MSCPNTPAPKCCAPPKKECAKASAPTCNNLPNTLTFTCPSDECQAQQAKPFCPEKPKDAGGCTGVGKVDANANISGGCGTVASAAASASAALALLPLSFIPESNGGDSGGSGGCETAAAAPIEAEGQCGPPSGGGGGSGGCSPNTSCEYTPLTMDGGCNK